MAARAAVARAAAVRVAVVMVAEATVGERAEAARAVVVRVVVAVVTGHLGVGLTLQQTLELMVLDRPRAILIEGIEELVDVLARRSEAEHGHRLAELLPRYAAVAILIPFAKEPHKLSMVDPKGLPER